MDLVLNETEIQENHEKLQDIIASVFSGERKEKLQKLFADYDERIALAPASTKLSYHNAFPGGYADHVLRVCKIALRLTEVWKEFDATIEWTTENLMFAAINHDLGKLGDNFGEQYIPNESEWHVRNQGAVYKMNDDIDFIEHAQRSLFILNQYGIAMNQTEYLAILLHHGMYEEYNRFYLMPFSEGRRLKSNMAIILHQADVAASRIEYELYKKNQK